MLPPAASFLHSLFLLLLGSFLLVLDTMSTTRRRRTRLSLAAVSPASSDALLSDAEEPDDARDPSPAAPAQSKPQPQTYRATKTTVQRPSLWQCFVGELVPSERTDEEDRCEQPVDNIPGFLRVLISVEKVRLAGMRWRESGTTQRAAAPDLEGGTLGNEKAWTHLGAGRTTHVEEAKRELILRRGCFSLLFLGSRLPTVGGHALHKDAMVHTQRHERYGEQKPERRKGERSKRSRENRASRVDRQGKAKGEHGTQRITPTTTCDFD